MVFGFRREIRSRIFFERGESTYYIMQDKPSIVWRRKWCGGISIELYLHPEEQKTVLDFFAGFDSQPEAQSSVSGGGGAGSIPSIQLLPPGPQKFGGAA